MAEIIPSENNGIYHLKLAGEIDAGSSVDLDQAINQGVRPEVRAIVIDCQTLEYISSAGLGVFMSYVEDFREKNIRMILHSLNERVAHTFQLLGLSDLLTIVPSQTEAEQILHEN